MAGFKHEYFPPFCYILMNSLEIQQVGVRVATKEKSSTKTRYPSAASFSLDLCLDAALCKGHDRLASIRGNLSF